VLTHPVLIVVPLHTIHLVVKVRKPGETVPRLGAPVVLGFLGTIGYVLWSARKVYWPGKRRMAVFTHLQAFLTSSKMLAAALLCCPIKLKLVGRMKLGLAVSDGRVWEPRAIPPRMAASKRVGVDGLLA